MKRFLALILLFAMAAPLAAQRYRNPDQYLRQFTNQNRKIGIKNLLYLTATLKDADERRIAKYREIVLEQLKDSKREIERTGNYEDYEILKREYVKALEQYIGVFEKEFGAADTLLARRYDSYQDLQNYYDAVTAAEAKMLEASYRMEEAEDHFAKTYYFTVERDEELEEQYRLLDEVTLYSRDMTLAFFRTEQGVQKWLRAVEAEERDSLPQIVTEIRKYIKQSRSEVEEYADFEGEDDLYKEVKHYLDEMQDAVNQDLQPLSEQLKNKFLDEKEYRDAQRDLERFVNWHSRIVEDFFETKRELIEDYLPD